MRIGVIGLGKLGLPLLAVLAKANHSVIGYDISSNLIESLQLKNYEFNEPNLTSTLQEVWKNIEYTTELKKLVSECELICVIVPTPSIQGGKFSNKILIEICKEIGSLYSNFDHELTVNIVSTVMPGSCNGILKKELEESSGKTLNEKFGLTYNPEFIALGSVIHDMTYPDMHLLGATYDSHAKRVGNMLQSIVKKPTPLRIMNLDEAELVKISINNFVTFKIAFANMLGQLANELGNIDIDTVTQSIGLDSRVGSKYLKSGTPYGGPCFPRDTKALAALLEENGIVNSLPKTVDSLNSNYYQYLKSTILKSTRSDNKIGILGLSYKPNTEVIEESTGVWLLNELNRFGVQTFAWDPLIKTTKFAFQFPNLIDDISELILKVDLIVISRNFSEININEMSELFANKKVIDLWRNNKN